MNERVPRLGPWLLLCGVLAVGVDLGAYHAHHGSDSLVPVLCSLYRWTPFYWECNRIGMLEPLLALPFHSPMTNLLVQCGLALFGTFATLFLLPRYVLRDDRWPLAGVLAASLPLLCMTRKCFADTTFFQQHYPTGMALGLGALLLTEPGRRTALRLAAALALILLAHWANSATTAILAPVVLLRGVLCGSQKSPLRRVLCPEIVRALAVLGAGEGGSVLFRWLRPCPGDPAGQGFLAPSRWPDGWARLVSNTFRDALQPHWPVLAALAAAALLVAGVPALRRWVARPGLAALALAGGILTYGLFTGTLRWVAMNAYCSKYWIPVLFLLYVTLALVLVAPVAALGGRARRTLTVLAAPALLLAALVAYGPPSLRRVRADLDHLPHSAALPQRIAEILQTRATHVTGSYGDVWVSVFLANLALYERGEHRIVWGVSGRCLPTWDLWGQTAPEDLRVAALTLDGDIDPDAAFFLDRFFPPLVRTQERPTLALYGAREAVDPRPDGPILLSWHSGFTGSEGYSESGPRWCAAQGKLTICNTTVAPRIVNLEMDLWTGQRKDTSVYLDSPLFQERVRVNDGCGHFQRIVVVPPGRHLVCFECDARPVPSRDGWRRFVFWVTNFKMRYPLEWSAGIVGKVEIP